MIPPHDCTPYCNGQRYCMEEGTHTMAFAHTLKWSKESWQAYFNLYCPGVAIIRVVECPDMPNYGGSEKSLFPIRPENENDVAWLVTVKEIEL